MGIMPYQLAVFALAILLDVALGDPPNAIHPVAWMGTVISAIERLRQPGRLRPLLQGLLLAVLGTGFVATAGLTSVWLFRMLPSPMSLLAEAWLLKATFSIRGLVSAAKTIQSALAAGKLPEARRLLGWHLVSRDTSSLGESQIAAGTIESLAENTSDSIVAPLMFYAVAGLPGALAYRFINTCDAVLGYRDQQREWLGKVPARLDDLANLIPARLTAALMIAAGALLRCDLSVAVAVWWRDRHRTSSPNAGHPMSAAAGVLGIRLEKVGQYRLGDQLRSPVPADIPRAIQLLLASTLMACVVLAGLLFLLELAR